MLITCKQCGYCESLQLLENPKGLFSWINDWLIDWLMMHQKTAKWRTMRTTAIVWIPTKNKPETTFRRQKWLNMIVVTETESIHLVPTQWRKKRQVITENIDLSLQSSQNLLFLHSTNFSKFHPPILLAEWKSFSSLAFLARGYLEHLKRAKYEKNYWLPV